MIKREDIHRAHVKSSAKIIISSIEKLEAIDIINSAYVKTTSYISLSLIKKYEEQLVKAKLNPNEFRTNLRKFYKDMAKYIQKENFEKDFFDLCYLVYIELNKKANAGVFNSYLSLLMEQATRFYKEGQIACGIDREGNLIMIEEPFKKLEYGVIEWTQLCDKNKISKQQNLSTLKKYLKKYGYEFKDMEEVDSYIVTQMLVTNMYFTMTPLINENDVDIVNKPFYMASNLINIKEYRKKRDTNVYIEDLRRRSKMVPIKGIEIIINKECFAKEVLIKEKFSEDKMYMLYRIKIEDNAYISGFFDLKEEFFYSIWKDNLEYSRQNAVVENLILEIYATFTTDNIYNNSKDFEIKLPLQNQIEKNKENFASMNDKIYNEESAYVRPYIRKLPEGAKASEGAKELAEKYGYYLTEDETFVSEFVKKVYVK